MPHAPTDLRKIAHQTGHLLYWVAICNALTLFQLILPQLDRPQEGLRIVSFICISLVLVGITSQLILAGRNLRRAAAEAVSPH